MKKAIQLSEQAGTKRVQVQIARRIDGKEIACFLDFIPKKKEPHLLNYP